MFNQGKRKMKMLSVLFAALVILAASTSSYGYFLVYNLSGTTRGVEDSNKVTIHFKGYLVMNFNNDSNSLVDSNMIIYGRDPNGDKVYVQLNASDANEFLDANILTREIRNFYALDGNLPFGFRSLLMGSVHRTTIGPANRKNIATTLSGAIRQETGIFLVLEHNLTGLGWMSASLFGSKTRLSNDPATEATQDTIINDLKAILDGKSYVQLSIPGATSD
jgi:hypothetical protein